MSTSTGAGGAVPSVRLPQAVWLSPETQAAMRDRRMGHLFLCAKKYAGASQARIASATGLHQSEVSRIQQGDRRVIAIDVLERIADGFAMPDAARLLVGLAPTNPPPDPGPARTLAPAAAAPAPARGRVCFACGCHGAAVPFPLPPPVRGRATLARPEPQPRSQQPARPRNPRRREPRRAGDALGPALLLGSVAACAATLAHAAVSDVAAAALLAGSAYLLVATLLGLRSRR